MRRLSLAYHFRAATREGCVAADIPVETPPGAFVRHLPAGLSAPTSAGVRLLGATHTRVDFLISLSRIFRIF